MYCIKPCFSPPSFILKNSIQETLFQACRMLIIAAYRMREAGLTFDPEMADLGGKITAGGTAFKTVNPEVYVPALQLDIGQRLTEGLGITPTSPYGT
jgi:hypothetical protein